MGECKTKAIQTNLGTFRHNQTYPGIIQAYSCIFRTLCNPGIFKIVVCPEPWHIQGERDIWNPGIFTTLVYLEPCQTSTFFASIFNGYNYFTNYIDFRSTSLRRFLLHEINIIYFFNTGLIFTPEVVPSASGGWRPWIFDILIDIFK